MASSPRPSKASSVARRNSPPSAPPHRSQRDQSALASRLTARRSRPEGRGGSRNSTHVATEFSPGRASVESYCSPFALDSVRSCVASHRRTRNPCPAPRKPDSRAFPSRYVASLRRRQRTAPLSACSTSRRSATGNPVRQATPWRRESAILGVPATLLVPARLGLS